jgi:hypothetical protein|nr:MAG TPA: hypothetical protein [Caudoviricetes sp.]DAJ43654.1 MAG TPA: hypothetical protein [Caudoviricetes sp.]
MFYLFCNHDWAPSVYFDAHESDKRVIRAFAKMEAELVKELRKKINGGK